jgi:hypothetical protein
MVETWYLPSFYGDVRLTRLDAKLTRVSWEKLTVPERTALDGLARKADKKWCPRGAVEIAKTIRGASHSSSGLFDPAAGAVLLDAKLEDVRKVIARSLKPGREVVDVVRFADGKIVEEVSGAAGSAETVAGVTVAKPKLGCPEPRLSNAELRAREVLFAFTTPVQQEDFLRTNTFVSQGAGTGHLYMVTSRHARGQLAVSRRQLFDLDENTPYCVHDYSVPAAEEMLALHVMMQIPWGERYLRHLH